MLDPKYVVFGGSLLTVILFIFMTILTYKVLDSDLVNADKYNKLLLSQSIVFVGLLLTFVRKQFG